MKILICDDNIKYTNKVYNIIKSILKEHNIEHSICVFNDYNEALNFIKKIDNYDKWLYILDIDLGSRNNGITLGREIRRLDSYKGDIIYITGYTHQMSNIFKYKLKVLDFIDKGFNLEKDISESLKAYITINKHTLNTKKITIRDGIKCYEIDPENIIFIETDKSSKKIIITCINQIITARISLKDFINIAPHYFIQIHRCCIVNKKHILSAKYIDRTFYILLSNNTKQPVSKRREKKVKECTIL